MRATLQPAVQVLISADSYFQRHADAIIELNKVALLSLLMRKYQEKLIKEFREACDVGRGSEPKNIKIWEFSRRNEMAQNIGKERFKEVTYETAIYLSFIGQERWALIGHTMIDRFFRKHRIQVISVTIEESKKFYQMYKIQNEAPGIIFGKSQLVLFEKVDVSQLLISLKESPRFIDKEQFQGEDLQPFHMLSWHKKEFKRYLKRQKIEVSQLKITQQFISFNSSAENFDKLCKCTNCFLMEFNPEKNVIFFESNFEQAIFRQICIPGLPHIRFFQKNSNISYVSGFADREEIEQDINTSRFKANKEIVLVPSLKVPSQLPQSMRLTEGSPQTKLLSFKLRCYNIDGKVKIQCRNMGSLYRNVGSAIFFISDLQKNPFVRSILKENNFSQQNFMDSVRGKSGKTLIEYHTEQSRLFDRAVLWYVNMGEKNGDRIRNEFNELLSLHFKERSSIRIILSQKSTQLPQLAIPICLQQLIKRHFKDQAPGTSVTTLDFIFEDAYEQQLCGTLSSELKRVLKDTEQESKLRTYSYIPISRFNIERMRTFRYISLFYKIDGLWVELSPIAAFYFYYEISKVQLMKRMLLNLHLDKKYKFTYLMVNQDEKIAVLNADTGAFIQYVRDEDELSLELSRFLQMKKRNYPQADSVVLNVNQEGEIERKMFEIEVQKVKSEVKIKVIRRVPVSLQDRVETQSGNVEIRMQLNKKSLYFIETHKDLKNKAQKLMMF